MTTAILKSINRSDLIALHSVYAAIHRAHKVRPNLFTVSNCTTAITALMSFNAWAWRVVGITPAALQKYKDQGFKYKPKQGITRAHLRPRNSTVADLLAPNQPLRANTFIKFLLRHDTTILCAGGEHKDTLPPYIPFANDDASRFASGKVSWRHAKAEETFLKSLDNTASKHHLVEPHMEITKKAVQRTGREPMTKAKPKKKTSHNMQPDYLGGARFIGVDDNHGGEFQRSTTQLDSSERAERRATHHRVEVSGNVYLSLWQAWKALKLPTSHHQPFRKKLKEVGKLTYPYRGKTYDFEIVS